MVGYKRTDFKKNKNRVIETDSVGKAGMKHCANGNRAVQKI